MAYVGLRVSLSPRPGSSEADASYIVGDFSYYEGELQMPSITDQHAGVEDKRHFQVDMSLHDVHVFVIGDWGAPLPHHRTWLCGDWDCNMQVDVASAMRRRAKASTPQYVLNAGDSFYLGGIGVHCDAAPGEAVGGRTAHEFATGWLKIYGELTHIPWIGTMGNHDYGGFKFTGGWSQIIGYSFVNHNWVMPARYFNRKIMHRGFLVEVYVIDSNRWCAEVPEWNPPNHNICGPSNPAEATCSQMGGMKDVNDCAPWFERTYKESKRWMQAKMSESTADWKIGLTHFPCEWDAPFWRGLHEKHGLDLLITGHRHRQELWRPDSANPFIQRQLEMGNIGKLACIVSGGGGGIKTEIYPMLESDIAQDVAYFGFFDVAISRERLNMILIDDKGDERGNWTISARRTPVPLPPAPAAVFANGWACHAFQDGQTAEWCRHAGTYHGIQYKIDDEGWMCGGCACCKRPSDPAHRWETTQHLLRVE